MANVAQGGFRFKRMKSGGHQYQPMRGPVTTNNSTGIFFGDAVKRTSAGDFVVAAAGDAIAGFCCGVEQYQGTDGVLRKGGLFLPASTTYSGGLGSDTQSVIRIVPALGALFEVDANAATVTTLANWMAMIGENVDLAAGAGGNTTTGMSSMTVASAGHATTNTLAFRIEDVSQRFDNDPATVNFKLLVSVNLCQDVPYVILGT
jgi:hypothetical protein